MKKAKKYKIPMVAIFPYTPKNKKDNFGTEAFNENNLICKSLKFIIKRYSVIGVSITGLVSGSSVIRNIKYKILEIRHASGAITKSL